MPRWLKFSVIPAIIVISLIAGIMVARYRTASAVATGKPVAITQLPEFSLNDLQGRPRAISEWRSKFLLLNFWATWCAPCRREMPLLQTIHHERAALGFAVVGIAIDRADQVQSFVAESGVNYPILVGQDDAMQLAETLVPDFVALPLSVIVAPGGDILTIHLGELSPADLRRIVAIADGLVQGKWSIPEARLQLENGLKRR